MLGWIATLDVLGYHHAQKRTIPFSLLGAAMKMKFYNPNSEFIAKYYNMVEETCLAIMEDIEHD